MPLSRPAGIYGELLYQQRIALEVLEGRRQPMRPPQPGERRTFEPTKYQDDPPPTFFMTFGF